MKMICYRFSFSFCFLSSIWALAINLSFYFPPSSSPICPSITLRLPLYPSLSSSLSLALCPRILIIKLFVRLFQWPSVYANEILPHITRHAELVRNKLHAIPTKLSGVGLPLSVRIHIHAILFILFTGFSTIFPKHFIQKRLFIKID